MPLEIRLKDKEFTDSPDAGHPDCICSRCGSVIAKKEMPLRAFNQKNNTEYRYCESCQTKMGIRFNINF